MRIALIILMMLAAVGTAHAFLLIGTGTSSPVTSCAFHLTGNAHLTGTSNLRCGP